MLTARLVSSEDIPVSQAQSPDSQFRALFLRSHCLPSEGQLRQRKDTNPRQPEVGAFSLFPREATLANKGRGTRHNRAKLYPHPTHILVNSLVRAVNC